MLKRILLLLVVIGLTALSLLTPYIATVSSLSKEAVWNFEKLVTHFNYDHWIGSPPEFFHLVLFIPLIFAIIAFFVEPPFSSRIDLSLFIMGIFGLAGWFYTVFDMSFTIFVRETRHFFAYYAVLAMVPLFCVWSILLAVPRLAKLKYLNFLFGK